VRDAFEGFQSCKQGETTYFQKVQT
jgi:hypothetical protein